MKKRIILLTLSSLVLLPCSTYAAELKGVAPDYEEICESQAELLSSVRDLVADVRGVDPEEIPLTVDAYDFTEIYMGEGLEETDPEAVWSFLDNADYVWAGEYELDGCNFWFTLSRDAASGEWTVPEICFPEIPLYRELLPELKETFASEKIRLVGGIAYLQNPVALIEGEYGELWLASLGDTEELFAMLGAEAKEKNGFHYYSYSETMEKIRQESEAAAASQDPEEIYSGAGGGVTAEEKTDWAVMPICLAAGAVLVLIVVIAVCRKKKK